MPPKVAKPPIAVPADFRAALRRTKGALAAFDAMPPSHKRAYLEAIEEAKKPDTRARRIAGAIPMILAYAASRARTSRHK
jgi:uncharacterized protein YdeI (YjbR/CyaY-like superfamily)